MKTINFFITALVAVTLIYSCKDDDPCTTYETDIKPIIEASCSYSGCHSGADAGMWVSASSKDYTNYEGLIANLESGSFAERVLDSMDMPSPYAPMGYPTDLTQAELDLIDCWISDGYPEK
ncbi:MAG: hypothetical protein AB8H03_28770 [Saprospiraceae bacterium]